MPPDQPLDQPADAAAGPPVELRPMHWWDLEAVVALERELFAGYPPWSAEQFWSELAGVPDSRWYAVAVDAPIDAPIDAPADHQVHEQGDEHVYEPSSGPDVVGYAGLALPGAPGDSAGIHTIAVAPRRQRAGVGSLLMDALLEQARRHGAAEVFLEVRADNVTALAFYQRHGFERVSLRRGYFGRGRDGLVLRVRLDASSPAPR